MSVKVTTLLLCLYDYYKKPKSRIKGKKCCLQCIVLHCYTLVQQYNEGRKDFKRLSIYIFVECMYSERLLEP